MLVDDQVVRAARAGEPIPEPELTTIQRLADAVGVEPEALMSLPTE